MSPVKKQVQKMHILEPGWTNETDTHLETGIASSLEDFPDISLALKKRNGEIVVEMFDDEDADFRLSLTIQDIERLQACCAWLIKQYYRLAAK